MKKLINYRAIAEEYFNKKLEKSEIVHHIDGNRENNEPENLLIMKKSQHDRFHLTNNRTFWESRNVLCRSCLFVRLFESFKKEKGFHDKNDEDILFEIADGFLMWGKLKRNNEILEHLYNSCLMFKRRNDHDCYKKKNLCVECKDEKRN